MTSKESLSGILGTLLIAIPFGAAIGIQGALEYTEREHYNSLSRQGKIEYLQNQLDIRYNHPPIFAGPRGGAAMLAMNNAVRDRLKARLDSLIQNLNFL